MRTGSTTAPGSVRPTPHRRGPGRRGPGPACVNPGPLNEIPGPEPMRAQPARAGPGTVRAEFQGDRSRCGPGQGGRARLAQCEPSATQSASPRAVRAQRDIIHLSSIRASPPGAMRAQVTSPKRLPQGRVSAGLTGWDEAPAALPGDSPRGGAQTDGRTAARARRAHRSRPRRRAPARSRRPPAGAAPLQRLRHGPRTGSLPPAGLPARAVTVRLGGPPAQGRR